MTNAEHLIENAVTALERHDPYDAYRKFMENPVNAEMAALAGVTLDAVWEMAMYCCTTLRTEWQGDGRWIPVTERLPEHGERVLTYDRYGHIRDRVLKQLGNTELFTPDGLAAKKHITHWMPMPDAPEEEEQ